MGEKFRRELRQSIHSLEAKDPTRVVKKARETSESAFIRSQGGIRINEWLWYDFDSHYPKQLNLHVSAVGSTKQARVEAFRAYKAGMDILAGRLAANDPAFEGIETVAGWSELVLENRGAL